MVSATGISADADYAINLLQEEILKAKDKFGKDYMTPLPRLASFLGRVFYERASTEVLRPLGVNICLMGCCRGRG